LPGERARRRRGRRVALGTMIALAACHAEPSALLLPPESPPSLRAACELAADRCSRCHTVDRILNTRPTEPAEWRRYVRRMRLNPSSRIAASEEPTIVNCLVFRTFGQPGLDQLDGRPR